MATSIKRTLNSQDISVNVYAPHENQVKIINSDARFKVICCGRRFGKTMFALNTLFLAAILKENQTFWYVAPTYKQAKMIAWRMMMDLYRRNEKLFLKKPNESALEMVLINNSYIELKGADNEDSLRGVGLDGVVLDEYALMRQHVWQMVVQPMLVDSNGWAIFISTPKGYNHFYDLYQEAQRKKNWQAFHFTTYDNPYMKADEISRIKNSMSEDYFAQEFLADFRKFTGLVYKDFQRDIHAIDSFAIPDSWARWRTIDAGLANPFVCLWIAQDPESRILYVYDEHYVAGQTTRYHAEIINGKSHNEYFKATYIDPSAAQVMKDLGMYQIYCTKGVNTIISEKGSSQYMSGITKIMEMLKVEPATEQPRIKIFSHCKNLIREFETYRWEEKKSEKNAREVPHKEDDHALDALRYFFNTYNINQILRVKKEYKAYIPRNPITGY